MGLNKFAETYYKLEEKALQIMAIHGIGHYDLDGIGVEKHKGKSLFNIKASLYYSGCGVESECLTFDLEEISSDICYFEDKHKERVERLRLEKKLASEKEAEKGRLLKEAKDKADYERLKLKFETKTKN